MAETNPKLKNRELLKGVKLDYLSNAYKCNIRALFSVPVVTLNRCKNVSKKM